jgi:hypothetical protein
MYLIGPTRTFSDVRFCAALLELEQTSNARPVGARQKISKRLLADLSRSDLLIRVLRLVSHLRHQRAQ